MSSENDVCKIGKSKYGFIPVISKKRDFDRAARSNIWNFLTTSYLKRVVAVTSSAVLKIVWTYAICPKSVYSANFKQKVLIRLAYGCAPDSKVLIDGHFAIDFDV